MINLDSEKNIVTIKKHSYSLYEEEKLACYSIPLVDGTYRFNLAHVTRDVLTDCIHMLMPNIRELQGSRELGLSINDCYKKIKDRFEIIARDRIPFYDKLMQHQKEGLQFCSYRKYSLMSFEQGLGKTVTAIAKSLVLDSALTIVICPATLKWNWYEELVKVWGFDRDMISLIDTKKGIKAINERIVLINYELLKRNIDNIYYKKPTHIIIDECHFIKNRDSSRSKLVADICRNTKAHVTMLSGTPSPNKVVDMFMYLNIFNHPFGRNYTKFLDRFTIFRDTRFGKKIIGGKNIQQLHNSLGNVMIRKLKRDCLDLPDKNYIKINFEFDEYKEEYEEKMRELIEKVASRGGDTGNIDAMIHPLNIITSKCKVKDIVELAQKITEDEVPRIVDGQEVWKKKKVIIFTSYSEPITMLQKEFDSLKLSYVTIQGGVEGWKRQALVNKFREDDNCNIFIGNITAAGTGLNLTEASDVIFVNFPMTQAEIDQCTDRAHRKGQTKQVNVYYTVCKDSIDEQLFKMVNKKYLQVSHVVDGKEDQIETEDVASNFIAESLFKNYQKTEESHEEKFVTL